MGPDLGRGFWPLLASTPWTFAALCHPWLLKVVGGDVHPPRPLGSVCRAMAGQCSRNTEVCLGARRPLGQIRRISGPNASHAEGLPTGAGGGRSREWVSFPSTQVMAGRTGLLFLQSGLADRAAQVAGEGPRKENRKKEMKNQWLKYSVSRRVGLGVPGPSPGGVLSTWRNQHEEGWNLADGFGLGGLGKVGNEVAGWRSYLIFWAHFMSSARGFSPVRPWMRSSRRRQKPIFSRG